MTPNGDIFLSIIRKNDGCNELLKTTVDDFYTMNSLVSTTEFEFQHTAASTELGVIAVSAAKAPVTPYSKQDIRLYDYNTGQFLKSFGQQGKEQGQLWCARALDVSKTTFLIYSMYIDGLKQ